MEHEFDSSWTCNYCGITEEKAKRGEQCPKRMREQLANATPLSSVEYIGPERKITAFVINVPQRLTTAQHVAISSQWKRVMAGTVHENTPCVICEAGMTVQAIDEPVEM